MSDHEDRNHRGDARERPGPGDPASSHGSDLDARSVVGPAAQDDAQERSGRGDSSPGSDQQTDPAVGGVEPRH